MIKSASFSHAHTHKSKWPSGVCQACLKLTLRIRIRISTFVFRVSYPRLLQVGI